MHLVRVLRTPQCTAHLPTFSPLLTPLHVQIFLGSLRDSEVQRVSERVGQSVLDTLLATTIFRQDISAVFIALFVVMCFLKIYHWLLADRVDYLETSANISLATHVRLASFGLLLLVCGVFLGK